jgi:hypothetical protein
VRVDLIGATINGTLEMANASFAGPVYADNLSVADSLFIDRQPHLQGKLSLIGASVGGSVYMTNSAFDSQVMADRLKVAGSLFMRDGTTFRSAISLIGAKITGNIDLRHAVAVDIDLSQADAAELLVAGLKWWCLGGTTPNVTRMGSIGGDDDELSTFWPLDNQLWRQIRCASGISANPPKLTLRNFHVADFQDNTDA